MIPTLYFLFVTTTCTLYIARKQKYARIVSGNETTGTCKVRMSPLLLLSSRCQYVRLFCVTVKRKLARLKRGLYNEA